MRGKKSVQNCYWVIDSQCHCFGDGTQNFVQLGKKQGLKQSARPVT